MDSSIHSEFFRSNVTAIILRSLQEENRYGYDILKEIDRKSQGSYQIKQATLYSCLKRLEKSGFINAFWGEVSGGGRRRYYSLTERGRDFLSKNQLEYEYSRTLLDKLLSDKEYDLEETPPFDLTESRTVTRRKPASPAQDPDSADQASPAAEAEPSAYGDEGLVAAVAASDQTTLFDEPAAAVAEAEFQSLSPAADSVRTDYDGQKPPAARQDDGYMTAYKEILFEKESQAAKTYDKLFGPEDPSLTLYDEAQKHQADFNTRFGSNAFRYDYSEQREFARRQEEEYQAMYRERLHEKESLASKSYDKWFGPSINIASIATSEKLAAPVPAPEKPKELPAEFDLSHYSVKSENLTEDERRDYAAKKLGIGRFKQKKDPAYPNPDYNQRNPDTAPSYAPQEDSRRNSFASEPSFEPADTKQYPNPALTVSDELQEAKESEEARAQAVKEPLKQENPSFVRQNTAEQDEKFFKDSIADTFEARMRTFTNEDAEPKFQRYEKYDAANEAAADDVNYKSVFSDEILPKRADQKKNSDSAYLDGADDIPAQDNNRAANFNEVKNKLNKEGYEVRLYSMSNTSDFYAKNYIYNRKINMHAYFAAYGVWLVEAVIALLLRDFFLLNAGSFLAFLLIPLAVPLYYTVLYFIKPDKRIKDDFDIKQLLKSRSIAAGALFILMLIASAFLGGFSGKAALTILLPAILFCNIPLSVVIYAMLRKTRKYNLN